MIIGKCKFYSFNNDWLDENQELALVELGSVTHAHILNKIVDFVHTAIILENILRTQIILSNINGFLPKSG